MMDHPVLACILFLGLAILLLLAIIVIRGLLFKPYPVSAPNITHYPIDEALATEHFRGLIRCKTISSRDSESIDYSEYEKLHALIAAFYPLLHKHCPVEHIGASGLLYKWSGASASEPIVCMAHYDVVPVDLDGWTKSPFDAILEDGILWGRGTLDTKGTFCGILEAAEYLLSQGYEPKQDIYFSFSGDEEVDGPSCPAIVAELEKRGITPALVLDEGGAVVEGAFPGVPGECALIGIAEKGSLNVDFVLKNNGGHASTPPPHTPVGKLAIAINHIENNPFPTEFTKPVLEMFDTLGRHSNLLYRMIFSNLWCFKPVLAIMCKKSGGELNAMLRTTCAMTCMEGSHAYNVIPASVSAGANLRLLGSQTMESAIAYLKKIINNPDISIEKISGSNPSSTSETGCTAWNQLPTVIHNTWPDAIVAPYLMMACSDSRHYCKISDHVYRFSAMKLSKEERGMIHGNDERIPIATFITTIEFYISFLKSC